MEKTLALSEIFNVTPLKEVASRNQYLWSPLITGKNLLLKNLKGHEATS